MNVPSDDPMTNVPSDALMNVPHDPSDVPHDSFDITPPPEWIISEEDQRQNSSGIVSSIIAGLIAIPLLPIIIPVYVLLKYRGEFIKYHALYGISMYQQV